jgi:hypothetical protein
MPSNTRLPLALVWLRLGVFVVMLMWTIDKFVRPQHTAAVFGAGPAFQIHDPHQAPHAAVA